MLRFPLAVCVQIDWLIKKRKNFKQLEDFNTKQDADDEEYQRQYHARMAGRPGKK